MSRRKKVDYAEDSDSEEFEDFSASEDEWQPQNEVSEAESDASDADFDEESTSKLGSRSSLGKRSRPSSSASGRKPAGKPKRAVSTLRSRMIKKFNLSRTSNTPTKPISKDITRILEQSQYQRRKSITSSQDGNDSDSSGDDHLVNMNKLDLKSSFFDIDALSKSTALESKVPEFDCNAGMKLSDSEDDEEMEEVKPNKLVIEKVEETAEGDEDEKKKSSSLIAGINRNSAGQIDFHQLVKYNIEAQEAEEKLKSIRANSIKQEENLNVSKLLALGEGASSSTLDTQQSEKKEEKKGKATKKRKKATRDGGSESDSDWEQVQDQSQADIKDVLQINIPLAGKSNEERKKGSQDVEMMIKRKLNRDLKEQQLYLHKVSLICHIAHGLYCNKVLNSPILMTAALKLLPNKSCYPDGDTCIKYFESIAKWYKQAIPIRKNQMYLGTKKRPKMGVSLALQIKYKEALCKKDFVLIFIILLRAMGFPCRLVINLTPISIRPPQEKLHSLSTKLKDEKKSGQKATKSDTKDIIKEISRIEKKSQKNNEDHDYCVSSKSKEKCKKSESKHKSEGKKAANSHNEEGIVKSKSDSIAISKGSTTDKKSQKSASKSSVGEKSEKAKHTVSHAKKPTVSNEEAKGPAKKTTKIVSRISDIEVEHIEKNKENGPTNSKRVKKQSTNSDLQAKSEDASENKKQPPSLSEKLKKRTTLQMKSEKQTELAGPPTLVHANQENQTIEREDAPLLSPEVVESEDNTKVKSNKDSSDEGATAPKRSKTEPENNSQLPNKSTVTSPPKEEILLADSTKLSLSAKLNKRGRKKKIIYNETNEKKEETSTQDIISNVTKLDAKKVNDNEDKIKAVASEEQLVQSIAIEPVKRQPRKKKIINNETNENTEETSTQDIISNVTKADAKKVNDNEDKIKAVASEEQLVQSIAIEPVKRQPRNKNTPVPTLLEPSKDAQNLESNETEPFKEIKKNTGTRRTRSSPLPKITLGNASTAKSTEKVESIHFRVPTTRTTRSQTKQKGTNDKEAIPQMDGTDDSRTSSKKTKTKSRKPHESDDDDFVPIPNKKPRPSTSTASKQRSNKDRKVLSSSSEEEDNLKTKKMDIWVEVYSEKEEKWVTINLFKTQVNNPDELRKSATVPVAYVFAWNNDNSMKDVSPRYCPQWNTATRKQRVEKEWLDDAIRHYLERKTTRSKAEDLEFHRMHIEKPLPTAISEFKNHPLYALQRHLLKFEAIYPADALTLGFIRGEPVYSRDCVHTLHSREIWLKSARVVKPGEKPYKVVKARPKWDRLTQSVIKDLPLEIFGKWQTMDYDPPTAENGRVPRNAYGNVDLFKPTMLPKKTVHLDLPGLPRVCKKLKIDCAPAVVGFDFHQGACHPIVEGYVICEEFQDIVIDAWNREQEEAERKEDEKYYQRVYGNWKKLYRGLLIRERLKKKYNFKTLKIDDGTKPVKKKKT